MPGPALSAPASSLESAGTRGPPPAAGGETGLDQEPQSREPRSSGDPSRCLTRKKSTAVPYETLCEPAVISQSYLVGTHTIISI